MRSALRDKDQDEWGVNIMLRIQVLRVVPMEMMTARSALRRKMFLFSCGQAARPAMDLTPQTIWAGRVCETSMGTLALSLFVVVTLGPGENQNVILGFEDRRQIRVLAQLGASGAGYILAYAE